MRYRACESENREGTKFYRGCGAPLQWLPEHFIQMDVVSVGTQQ